MEVDSPPPKRNFVEINKNEQVYLAKENSPKKQRTVFVQNSAIHVPKTMQELTSLNHEQILNIFREHIFPQNTDAIEEIEKKKDVIKQRYPKNALNGMHLYNSIKTYETNLRSNGTEETAKQKMIADIMEEDKVTSKSVAQFICNWLCDTFIVTKEDVRNQEPKTLQSFFERVLGINLNKTDRTLQQVVEASCQLLIKSFGYQFKFIGRTPTMTQITNIFKTYFDIFLTGKEDKQNIKIPVVAAAPGVGKSKLLKEVCLSFFKNASCIYSDQNCICFPIFINFGNGTSTQISEQFLDAPTSLCIRIIFSIYRGLCSSDNTKLFGTFVDELLTYFGSKLKLSIEFTLTFLHDILYQLFSAETTNKKIRFIIAIDEVHNVDGHNSDKTLSPLRAILSTIGEFMICSERFVIHPILAGTYHTVIDEHFKESTYYPIFIPLKGSLREEEQGELLDNLASLKTSTSNQIFKYPKLQNWRTNREFRQYLRTFGGFPRGIEYYLQSYLSQDMATTQESWQSSAMTLKQNYGRIFAENFKEQIAKLVFTRKLVSKNDSIHGMNDAKATLSDLEHIGAVILDFDSDSTSYLVNYPAILLEYCFTRNNYLRRLFRSAFLTFQNTTWQTWEHIIHIHTFILLQMFAKEENVQLHDIIPFGLQNTTNISFQPFDEIQLLTSIHQLHFDIQKLIQCNQISITSTNELVPLLTSIDLEKNHQVYVIKNAASAKAGDILIIGLKTIDNIHVVLHYQCKWSDVKSIAFASLVQEHEKNQTFTIQGNKEMNITVCMCGTLVTGIPSVIPQGLIIIHKSNFTNYFGSLSDATKCTMTQQFLRINEVDENELKSVAKIGKSKAQTIIEKRGSVGFMNMEDLQLRISKSLFTIVKDHNLIF